MAWISVDCRLPDHPKIAELPNDSARWGWLVVLLRAKEQRRPGTFTSLRHFKEVMGRHAKHLPAYETGGLLEVHDDGSLVVHDWQRYQWAAEKQRTRDGQSPDISRTNDGQEKDSRAGNVVPVPVSVLDVTGGEGAGEGARPDAIVAYYNLTMRFPRDRVKAWLEEMVATFGDVDVSTALGTEWGVDSNPVNFLSRVRNRLEQDAYQQRKKREDRERRRAEQERKLIESMPQEQREANMARLRGELQKSGLI